MRDSSREFDDSIDNIKAELFRLRRRIANQPSALPPGRDADEATRLLWQATIILDSASAAAMRARGIKL